MILSCFQHDWQYSCSIVIYRKVSSPKGIALGFYRAWCPSHCHIPNFCHLRTKPTGAYLCHGPDMVSNTRQVPRGIVVGYCRYGHISHPCWWWTAPLRLLMSHNVPRCNEQYRDIQRMKITFTCLPLSPSKVASRPVLCGVEGVFDWRWVFWWCLGWIFTEATGRTGIRGQ